VSTQAAVIELDGLSVRFGKRDILRNLRRSLTGRSIGLLGPNGAGKTTLLHTLLGFHPASSGSARIFGNDIRTGIRENRGIIGYMPENESFIAGQNGVRFVRMMAELSGLPPEQSLERAHEALFYVGLGEARYRPLESYSLGMKQRVKLAQAIVHAPRLLILDEPTNGLDPPARERMIRLIKEICDTGEVHLILSSHLLRDVEECCEEVLILKDGEIKDYCNLEEERRRDTRFLELETLGGDNGSFTEALQSRGCELATRGKKRLRVVLPEDFRIRDLYRIAAEKQVQIRRLDFQRDSLQDIFLKAMGEINGSL